MLQILVVRTENIRGDCNFTELQGALDFIHDQVLMGMKCSIEVKYVDEAIYAEVKAAGL